MVSIVRNTEIKHRLINLRQDPEYEELRSDIRKTIRYIEKLEKVVYRDRLHGR